MKLPEIKDIIVTKSKDNIFMIVQQLSFNKDNIKSILEDIKKEKDNNKMVSIIIDINNLSKPINAKAIINIINIIESIKNPCNKDKVTEDQNIRIFFKKCIFESENQIYINKEILNLKLLYISDELYSMTNKLQKLFLPFKPKELILKKMKINSKIQLEDFLKFINDSSCQELTLEDIFIELIVQNNKDDKHNELNKYFYYEKGEIKIRNINEKKGKIKKLKMIDCPLFAIKKDTFKNINTYKDILIDIDENSLLNPSFITKFKINEGFSYICFDLDSYKLKEDKEKDYIDYLEDLFNIIINNNYNMKKINFKNFDISKYEYITGENLTFIDEKNWVLNNEEKEKKKKYEEYEEKINIKIDENKDKLSNVKELIFDNCSNDFMKLIFKFINSSKNELDYLKIKKCGKDYFDLQNILSLNIKNLLLFDTPLIVEKFPKNDTPHLENFKGIKGKFTHLTIKINSLEHYCNENNLDYYRTLEIITELINEENFNQNICFEMNALPIIMTFLVAKYINKDKKGIEKYIIPTDFNFKSLEERQKLIDNEHSPFKIEKLENKTITIKKNNFKNRIENFYILSSYIPKIREQRNEYGNDIFDIDTDFKNFFFVNKIKAIILKDNIFSNLSIRVKEIPLNQTIINILRVPEEDKKKPKKIFKIDFKTLNDALFRNQFSDIISFIRQYLIIISSEIITQEQFENFNIMLNFIETIKYIFDRLNQYSKEITIILDNYKEKKQFYCLLLLLKEVKKEASYYEKVFNISLKNEKDKIKSARLRIPDKKGAIQKEIGKYFLKEQNEEKRDFYWTFNYYYTSKEEKKLFDEGKDGKEIDFDDFLFKIEYSDAYNNNESDNEKIEYKMFEDFIFE